MLFKRYSKYFLPLLATLALPAIFVFAQYNLTAPEISNVKITEVEPNSAMIEWKTNVKTDSIVHYGLNDNHGIVRYPLHDKKEHKIIVDKLEPSTTYHFRVLSSDEQGNKSTSAGYVFTTEGIVDIPGIEQVESSEERALVEKTFVTLGKITDETAIELIVGEVKKVAEDILQPPVIMGAPQVETGSDWAEISWFTDRDSGSLVHFSSKNEYYPESADPYVLSQGDSSELVTEHLVRIIGLKPSTVYHFKVASEDSLGLIGETEDDTFTTKSLLPEIRNIQILKVQETSATIAWTTDVLADALTEYTNLRTGITKSAGDPTLLTTHSVQLNELEFGTRYSVIIKSKNEAGDELVSEPFTFITVKDEIAPIISKVNNESTLFPGSEIKIQTIVAWKTDEPAFCQFFYSQGLATGNEENDAYMPKEMNSIAEHVQVVVGLAPATVYRFWMTCEDIAGNQSRSEDFVLFTPIKEKSIIDIILENFEGTFGWVKNITK